MNFYFHPSQLLYSVQNDGLSESKKRVVGRTNVNGARSGHSEYMIRILGSIAQLIHILCGKLVTRSESNQKHQTLSLHIDIVTSYPSLVKHYSGPGSVYFLLEPWKEQNNATANTCVCVYEREAG